MDFDGVIADSIRECLVAGYNAHASIARRNHRILSLDELDPERVASARVLRNFIRSGADYVYIFLALLQDERIPTQEAFDRFQTAHASLYAEFYRAFYRERQRLLKEHPGNWIRLNPLYPGMSDFLARYPDRERLCIITTKQIPFVLRILAANGISFSEDRAFHASRENPKPPVISGLLRRFGLSPSEFHFIDDQVDTLIAAKPLGIRVYAAGWGYINDEQRSRARRENIEILGRDAFFQRFSKNPSG